MSTIVDLPLIFSVSQAYKGSIMSTIVDMSFFAAAAVAYKGSIMSTIVDEPAATDKRQRL